MARPLPIVPIELPTPWPAVGPVYVYLIRDEPVTLIDTGLNTPDSRDALEAALREQGLLLSDIRRILLTHAHWDHYGLAGVIQAASGAELILHPDEEGKLATPDWWLEGRLRSMTEAGVPEPVLRQMAGLMQIGLALVAPPGPWRYLQTDEVLPFAAGELVSVHLPGHSLGHTAYLDRSGGLLVGGDHLLDGVTPNPVMEPVPARHPAAAAHAPCRALTLGQFLHSLERVAALPVGQVLPGHGARITDHVAVAERYRALHLRRLDALQARIAEPVTAYQLTQQVYPRVSHFDIFLALSEVLAHLDFLVAEGRAVFTAGRFVAQK